MKTTRPGPKRGAKPMSFPLRSQTRLPTFAYPWLRPRTSSGVDRATVGRWRIKFEADRRVTALLPRRRGRPAWISLIDPKVEYGDNLIVKEILSAG
jgi:hypothetical protein